jgi:hypothetical protein
MVRRLGRSCALLAFFYTLALMPAAASAAPTGAAVDRPAADDAIGAAPAALAVSMPLGGTVTGSHGLACGGASTACRIETAPGTVVTLTAVADPGYAFGGWGFSCTSPMAEIAITLDADQFCGVTFIPQMPPWERTFAVVQSQAGDPVGEGKTWGLGPANTTWQAYQFDRNTVQFVAYTPGSTFGQWSFRFAAPRGMPLVPGVYAPAAASIGTTGAGLDIGGMQSCQKLTGRFEVLEIEIGQDGVLKRFAADAEQHCNDGAPGLFAAVRYNSVVPGVVPFGGDFQRYELTLTPPSRGRIVGPGLSCGPGHLACFARFGTPLDATLTAVAEPGFVFTGWTGVCDGSATTTITVNMPKTCGATFAATGPANPLTLLYWNSTPGDLAGSGASRVYSAATARFEVLASPEGRGAQAQIRSPGATGESNLYMWFAAPPGQRLVPGTYQFWGDPNGHRMQAYDEHRTCDNPVGTFTIHELIVNGPTVSRLAVDFEQRCQPNTGVLRVRLRFNSTWPVVAGRRPADFDGDGKADPALFRPSDGVWYLHTSSAGPAGVQWGNAADVIAPGDYDGDGRTDIAVFRPSNAVWYLRLSGTGTTVGRPWGAVGDVPVPGDYDGDGKDDLAVFTPSTGRWSIQRSSLGAVTVQWGNSLDRLVPADYDGDGAADVAVFRPSTGVWYILSSRSGTATGLQWGNAGDVVVPADYDGDGRSDIAVFRPSNGVWYIVHSSTGSAIGVQWGNAHDRPVPADYDGDGLADIAVFRPSDGVWYIVSSSTGNAIGVHWGNAQDRPARVTP